LLDERVVGFLLNIRLGVKKSQRGRVILQGTDIAHKGCIVLVWDRSLSKSVVSVRMTHFVGFKLNPLLVKMIVALVTGVNPPSGVHGTALGGSGVAQ
jgi:hypothetical protein